MEEGEQELGVTGAGLLVVSIFSAHVSWALFRRQGVGGGGRNVWSVGEQEPEKILGMKWAIVIIW